MSASALVIGSASRLPAHHFLPFLRSLRAARYEGRTCLLVSQMASEDVAALRPLADDIVEVDRFHPKVAPDWSVRVLEWSRHTRGVRKHYPRLCRRIGPMVGAGRGNRVAEDLEFQLEGVQSLRYAHYVDYLGKHAEFEHVLISDVRDVL